MQEQGFHTIQELLNIRAATLIAGLFGAFITFLRKSDGSLQARFAGFLTAILTILYLLPFILWFTEWKFGIVPVVAAENFLAFICGMVSQRVTENFVDDPMGSVKKWAADVRRMKRVVWNGENEKLHITPKADNEVRK